MNSRALTATIRTQRSQALWPRRPSPGGPLLALMMATKRNRPPQTLPRPQSWLHGPVPGSAQTKAEHHRSIIAEFDCPLTTQSTIEPSLPPASPKNGNIRGISQRLSPNSVLMPGNREHRDGTPNCKSPLLAGLSATIGGIFSEPRTAWLATQC
jgi:hypothetical protein